MCAFKTRYPWLRVVTRIPVSFENFARSKAPSRIRAFVYLPKGDFETLSEINNDDRGREIGIEIYFFLYEPFFIVVKPFIILDPV